MEYITLTKNDPEFDGYLNGSFSKTLRALPIETYHADTLRERVTFRVVPLEKVDRPPWWKVYFWSCRPELLVLTMGPAIAAWLSHENQLSLWTKWPSWFALLGLFFMHTAVFLFNDVQDHLKGVDRLNRRRGSQVIQRGWVRAVDMRKWAILNGALAVIFAVPAFFNAPWGLLLISGLALPALVVVMTNFGAGFGLCDIALAMLFGPLLTTGIGLASFSEVGLSDFLIGIALGLMTAWTLQVRQFENLFRSRPEGFHTILGHLDFDHARWVVIVEAALLLVLQPALAIELGAPLRLLAVLPLVAAPSVLLIGRLKNAASPLSSSLVGCAWWALGAQLAWTLWWIAAMGIQWL
jgi:1,4-dihydroxy-2-naphthoate octaprenyltransferase